MVIDTRVTEVFKRQRRQPLSRSRRRHRAELYLGENSQQLRGRHEATLLPSFVDFVPALSCAYAAIAACCTRFSGTSQRTAAARQSSNSGAAFITSPAS